MDSFKLEFRVVHSIPVLKRDDSTGVAGGRGRWDAAGGEGRGHPSSGGMINSSGVKERSASSNRSTSMMCVSFQYRMAGASGFALGWGGGRGEGGHRSRDRCCMSNIPATRRFITRRLLPLYNSINATRYATRRRTSLGRHFDVILTSF